VTADSQHDHRQQQRQQHGSFAIPEPPPRKR
jgi:hypothetical protein